MKRQRADILASVCCALTEGDRSKASVILENEYRFAPETVTKRRFRQLDYTRVFIRDGFVDRYTGQRLVFPPVLRIISFALPERFPYHPNWKSQATHPAYWELSATVDHLVPVTRGGADGPSNWVTTSMARNSAKMNWSLDELGWELRPPGAFSEWDGLLAWAVDFGNRHPESVEDAAVRRWLKAASTALSEFGRGIICDGDG